MCSKSVINMGNTLLMKLFSSTNTHVPFCKPLAALSFSFHIHKKGRLNLKFLRKSWSSKICVSFFNYLFLKKFYFYFILLYNTVLVLPYIDMNPPRVYTSSQSWIPLPPTTPYHLSGSSPCTSPKHPVSCIKHRLVIRFLHSLSFQVYLLWFPWKNNLGKLNWSLSPKMHWTFP